MSEKTSPEDLPEFLNTEPDTTGEGLICTENGDRLSWEDLDRAGLVDETATVDDAEWLTKSMFYDDEWAEDL